MKRLLAIIVSLMLLLCACTGAPAIESADSSSASETDATETEGLFHVNQGSSLLSTCIFCTSHYSETYASIQYKQHNRHLRRPLSLFASWLQGEITWNDHTEVRCYECQGRGHLNDSCPMRGRATRRTRETCSWCVGSITARRNAYRRENTGRRR